MTRRRVRKRRSSKRVGAGLIKVHRRGYYRRAYDYVRDGKRIHVRGHYVRATDYYIRDRGKPGKGPKLIKVTPGKMTEWAVKLGYIREGQHIDDIPLSKIDDFALDLAKAVGPARAWRMFHAQIIYRKNATEPNVVRFRRKMERARDAIARAYPEALTPREAIEAWRRMSPIERAMRMPGGEI
ncbi:hypothetical protein DRO56_04895 [Candidatus Bathyarchaeota archaeon]|nr:MAG: hypothetical protein DRO56_04895 [Candidatus Bathyarchaeota archaeon]